MSTRPTVTSTIGDEERHDHVLEAAQQPALARQHRGAHEDEPQLDQLGRLELHAGQEPDPVAVAVDRTPNDVKTSACNASAPSSPGSASRRYQRTRDVGGDGGADDADGRELRLVEEDAEGGAVVAVGGDHRGRQDHDQADDDEDHRRAEQDVVGRDRRLQPREERQRPVQHAGSRGGAGRSPGRDERGGRVAVLVIAPALGPPAHGGLEGVAPGAVVGEHVHRRGAGASRTTSPGTASAAARSTTSSITSTPALSRHSLR